MTENCPDACRIRLDHLENGQKGHTHEGLWEELRMKVNQRTFFWMMGVAVVILLATFGAIYRQGGMTLEKVQAAQVTQATIQSELKNHTQNTEMVKRMLREIRRENGRDQ